MTALQRMIAFTVLITASFGDRMMSWGQSAPVIEVGKFSSDTPGTGLPGGWKPLTFKKITKQTEYVLVKDGEQVVVKATSDASASGLTREVAINPKDYPIVRWRWKVENLLQHSDVS
jgi:hypothetical protein